MDQTISMELQNVRPGKTSTNDIMDADHQDPSWLAIKMMALQGSIDKTYLQYKDIMWNSFYIILILLYGAYFAYAMHYRFGDEGSIRLLWVTCLVAISVAIYVIWKYYGNAFADMCRPSFDFCSTYNVKISW